MQKEFGEIHNRLYSIRVHYLRKTQREICNNLRISQSLLSCIEAGKSHGSAMFMLLYFYVNHYGINLNWVFADENRGLNVFLRDESINFF